MPERVDLRVGGLVKDLDVFSCQLLETKWPDTDGLGSPVSILTPRGPCPPMSPSNIYNAHLRYQNRSYGIRVGTMVINGLRREPVHCWKIQP